MFQETSGILIASFGLVFLAFVAGVILFVIQAKKNRLVFKEEKNIIAQQHQQELLETQLDIQHQTMQHIGTEIHDNVGQKLTLASLYTKQLAAGTVHNMTDKIAEVGNIIDESLTELRLLSKALTNPDLVNADLLILLNDEIRKINMSGICHITISCVENEIILPQAEKNILFRLLQEFIQNSLKHAGCRKINIRLEKTDGALQVTASDDGKGFDTTIASTGIGLENMNRRAAQIHASYELNSKPGEGTNLNLQLPIEK